MSPSHHPQGLGEELGSHRLGESSLKRGHGGRKRVQGVRRATRAPSPARVQRRMEVVTFGPILPRNGPSQMRTPNPWPRPRMDVFVLHRGFPERLGPPTSDE